MPETQSIGRYDTAINSGDGDHTSHIDCNNVKLLFAYELIFILDPSQMAFFFYSVVSFVFGYTRDMENEL